MEVYRPLSDIEALLQMRATIATLNQSIAGSRALLSEVLGLLLEVENLARAPHPRLDPAGP